MWYVLLICMIHNYFAKLYKSVKIYTDKRSYKPYNDIGFIDNLIKDYNTIILSDNRLSSVSLYVKTRMYEDYIGKFRFRRIKNNLYITRASIFLVSIILIVLTLMGEASPVVISVSIFISITTIVTSIIYNVTYAENETVMLLENYLRNQYHIEATKIQQEKNKSTEVSKLKSKIDNLQMELDSKNKELGSLSKELVMARKYIQALELERIGSKALANYYPLKDKDLVSLLKDII